MMATSFFDANGVPISAVQFIERLFGELDDQRLPDLLTLKFGPPREAIRELGINADQVRDLFRNFQQHLYEAPGA